MIFMRPKAGAGSHAWRVLRCPVNGTGTCIVERGGDSGHFSKINATDIKEIHFHTDGHLQSAKQ